MAKREGYYTDFQGTPRKVEIIGETKDGRLIIAHPSFRAYAGDYIIVKKEEVEERLKIRRALDE